METKSERLFCEACLRLGFSCKRIQEDGLTVPDYEVFSGSTRFIAEVKEICPNEADLKSIKSRCGGKTLGNRPRQHIKDAAKQLKRYKDSQVPLIVVLYDNVVHGNQRSAYPDYFTDPHDIDAAMYGVPMLNLSTFEERCGGRRTLTRTEKTYISAVIVLSSQDDSTLLVYHNFFAKCPLPPELFTREKCAQYRKFIGVDDDQSHPHQNPGDWVKIWPPYDTLKIKSS